MQQVTNLNLAYCHISTLEVAAFEGMDALRELKLESNRLNYLHGGPSLFPANVHHVEGRKAGRTEGLCIFLGRFPTCHKLRKCYGMIGMLGVGPLI